jgi:hypothetical protein
VFHLQKAHELHITNLGHGVSISRARADNPGEMLVCSKGILEHRLVGHETYDHRVKRWRHKVEDGLLGERNNYTAYLPRYPPSTV